MRVSRVQLLLIVEYLNRFYVNDSQSDFFRFGVS